MRGVLASMLAAGLTIATGQAHAACHPDTHYTAISVKPSLLPIDLGESLQKEIGNPHDDIELTLTVGSGKFSDSNTKHKLSEDRSSDTFKDMHYQGIRLTSPGGDFKGTINICIAMKAAGKTSYAVLPVTFGAAPIVADGTHPKQPRLRLVTSTLRGEPGQNLVLEGFVVPASTSPRPEAVTVTVQNGSESTVRPFSDRNHKGEFPFRFPVTIPSSANAPAALDISAVAMFGRRSSAPAHILVSMEIVNPEPSFLGEIEDRFQQLPFFLRVILLVVIVGAVGYGAFLGLDFVRRLFMSSPARPIAPQREYRAPAPVYPPVVGTDDIEFLKRTMLLLEKRVARLENGTPQSREPEVTARREHQAPPLQREYQPPPPREPVADRQRMESALRRYAEVVAQLAVNADDFIRDFAVDGVTADLNSGEFVSADSARAAPMWAVPLDGARHFFLLLPGRDSIKNWSYLSPMGGRGAAERLGHAYDLERGEALRVIQPAMARAGSGSTLVVAERGRLSGIS